MPLRRKILLSMSVPAALLLALGAIGIVSLHLLEQSAGTILSHNYESIYAAGKMNQTLWLLERAASPGSEDTSATAEQAECFEQFLVRCERNVTEAGEDAQLRDIRRLWVALGPQLRARLAQTPADSRTVLMGCDSLRAALDALVATNENAMFRYEGRMRRLATSMLAAASAALLLALGTMGLFSVAAAQRISEPVISVSRRLHQALNPEGRADSARQARTDEIALLSSELDALIERLERYENEHRKRLFHLQHRLAFVIDEVREGLVLTDTAHRVLAINRTARQILGLAEGDERRLDEAASGPEMRRLMQPVLDGSVQAERDLGEVRLTIDNAERVYRLRVLPVPGGQGHVEGYLLLFWDITEQKLFEESRRTFVAMLSHQLKTPMTSLSMSVSLLREKLSTTDPSHAELLAIAAQDCTALNALVSDLIEAARGPTPGMLPRARLVDIARLLQAALQPLTTQAEEKGVRLVLPDQAGTVQAWVDPVKFPWVVTNIAGNALRYTGPGGTVHVTVRATAGHFTVSVADTGPGIPEHMRARLFEPAIALEDVPEHGTRGLGLAIAKEIVDAHGGAMEVQSREGKGTTFLITVPLRPQEVA